MITDRIYRAARRWPFLLRQAKRVLRRLPHRRRRVSHFGQELFVDPVELHGFYLYYEREYDDYVFAFLEKRLTSFSRVLDLGANIGIYTVFLASRCRHVDAFEPEPTVLARLRENLHLNSLDNVTVHERCVADVTGTISFVSPTQENEGVGHIAAAGTSRPCVALDDFLRDASPEPLLVKMDIESGEWLALSGARQVLRGWKAPLALLMEIHPAEMEALGGSVKRLRDALAAAGLQIWALEPAGLRPGNPDQARFWWASNQPEGPRS
jgi:FkbM family methyltransferase